MTSSKIEKLNKKVKSFDVKVEFDIMNAMSNFKLNDLHLNEIDPEDIEHLEESNKKRLYIGTFDNSKNKSNTGSISTSRRENQIPLEMPPKLNIKIQTFEKLQTDSEKLFWQDLSKKKILKSNIDSKTSELRSRNTSG